MTDLFLPGAIFFLAAFVQGMTGFGAALVAIPLLCVIIDVKLAVPLCILNGLILTSYMAFKLRRDLDWAKIVPLLLGSLPGIAVGVLLLKKVDPSVLKMLIGVLLISYSLFNLVIQRSPRKVPRIFGYLAGFLSGAITASLSAGGPPAIIYTTLTDWTKDQIKATLTGFFVLNAYITVIAQISAGLIGRQVFEMFAGTVFFVLVGTAVGLKVADKINREIYLKLVLGFLLVMGLMMIWG